jgi:hypothetical protein
MMTEQQLIDKGYSPALARIVNRVIKDLCKVDGFELISARPWKSNLPAVMPSVGGRIESEIFSYIQGQEITILDQRRREVADGLEQIRDEYGNPYISTKWVEDNILRK